MRCTLAVLFLVPALWLAGPAAAQPDRTAALAKAKTKFEQDVSKAEDALIASLDKALKQAAGNKAMIDKLTYEREVFTAHRLVPTTVPTATYLKQRTQAIAALEAAYQPVIKELTKAKKNDDAEALDSALNDLVKSCRGYSLAIPDLEAKPVLLIEHKPTGMVIETTNKDGGGDLILGPKVGRKKSSQCWQLEREEKGYVIRNVASRMAFHVPYSGSDPGAPLVMWPPTDQTTKEALKGSLYRITEVRREVVITPAWNDLILNPTEKQIKGVTTVFITQEKKEVPTPSKQRWTLTEAK